MRFEVVDNLSLIKRDHLDPRQYTISLLKEGLRAGLADNQTIGMIQGQVMLILKDLIMRYTRGESSSVRVETAEQLLNAIYYSIDACICHMNTPEEGLTLLKTKSIREIYEKGIELLSSCVTETKELYEKIRRNKLEVPLEIYNSLIEEDLPDFFRDYGVVFDAHDTMCNWDYPVIFDDMDARGIYYVKQYLEALETETEFCSRFSKDDIAKTLINYGRIYQTDYAKSPVNLFEVLINNSIFAALLGNSAARLSISKFQAGLLQRKLEGLDSARISSLVSEAIEQLIQDLKITHSPLIAYIQKYKEIFMERVWNAVTNGSLSNMILTDAEEGIEDGSILFEDRSRMNDDVFRSVIRRITACGSIEDKMNEITANVHSLEDLTDLLNAGCLFGEEFRAVFAALNDMELAVLGKKIFYEELRNGLVNLAKVIMGGREIEKGWQGEYIGFLQGLDEDRLELIEGYVNVIDFSGDAARFG